jgi:hypothetical protein
MPANCPACRSPAGNSQTKSTNLEKVRSRPAQEKT